MPTIKISGSSDDIVMIEGDIHDEFYPNDDDFVVVISDGTVLQGTYNGFWRFNRTTVGSAEYSKVEGDDEDTNYSDVITLTGDEISWVGVTAKIAKVRK